MHPSNIMIIIFIIITINISFLQSQPSANQDTQRVYSSTIYFQSTSLFRCNIKLPDNYHQDKKYPLIIGLHGGNGSPDQFITIWDEIKHTEFIFAVPQAPYSFLMKENIGYEWSLWPTADTKTIEQAAVLSEEYIADLIKALKEQYHVSTIYLLGHSQGSIFAYRAGIKNYNLVDGIICLSGPGILEKIWSPFSDSLKADWLPEKYLQDANHLRVFIANGEKDKFTPVELGIKSRDILKRYGFEVTFHTFDGGHIVEKKILMLANNWLNIDK